MEVHYLALMWFLMKTNFLGVHNMHLELMMFTLFLLLHPFAKRREMECKKIVFILSQFFRFLVVVFLVDCKSIK